MNVAMFILNKLVWVWRRLIEFKVPLKFYFWVRHFEALFFFCCQVA
jgi:hypothetical protein